MAHNIRNRGTAIMDLNSVPTIIFFSLLLFELVASDGFISTCKTNQTKNKYENNLLNLFNNFVVSASSSSFGKLTFGESPNKAYGLYQCRGDATTKLCQSCVTNLTQWVLTEPDACSDGFGYMDSCMIHYANFSLFGIANNSVLAYFRDWRIPANVGEFNRTLLGMLEELIDDVANDSTTFFATREASVGVEDGKVYGLAQCTQDISKGNCSLCLKKAYSKIQKCCGDVTSAWFMLPSCQLRFDNSSFFDVSNTGGGSSAASLNPKVVSGFFLLLVCWSLFFFNDFVDSYKYNWFLC